MAIEVFNRYEHKYLINEREMGKILEVMDEHMQLDEHCRRHSQYIITNIYYDTPDHSLIRESLSHPTYKEKLRLRSYGVPETDSKVFVEIKKKFNGMVNKRRTIMKLGEAYDFLENGIRPQPAEYMNSQVMNEIEYFLAFHKPVPKVYIAYDRIAYFENGNDDLRISFDSKIRSRRDDLRLEAGDNGTLLLPEGTWLMEIKTSFAKPAWLCDMLTEMNIFKMHFSKYGTEYIRFVKEIKAHNETLRAVKQKQEV